MPKLRSSNLSILYQSIGLGVFNLLSASLMVGLIALLSRNYTAQDVGVFFFAVATMYLLAKIPSGFGDAIAKRVSETNTSYIEFLYIGVGFTLIYVILLGTISLTGISIAKEVTITDIKLNYNFILLLIIGIIGKSFSNLFRTYMDGLSLLSRSQVWNIILVRLFGLLLASAIIVKTKPDNILVIFAIYHSLGLLLLFPSLWYTYKLDDLYIKFSRKKIDSVFEFSKWSIPNGFLRDFYHRADAFFLAGLVGALAIGYYEGSVRILGIIFAFPSAVSSAIFIKVSGYNEEDIDYKPFVKKGMIIVLLFSTIVLIVNVLFAEEILKTIYTSDYIPAVTIFIALSVQKTIQSCRMILSSIINGVDKPHFDTIVSLISVILFIILAPIGIHNFGAVGVVLATITVELIRGCLLIRLISKTRNHR